MAQLLRFKYGGHTHEPGEVTNFRWEEHSNYTKRARRDTAIQRATLTIELLACDQAELLTKIDTLYAAYTQNDKEFVVQTVAGANTKFRIDPSSPQMLRGPMVTKIDCLQGDREEMVNKRQFTIELEALYDANESGIIYYEETLEVRGYTGPQYATVPVIGPAPALLPLLGVDPLAALRRYVRWHTGPQVIIQAGKSEGFGGWYDTPAAPLFSFGPTIYEDVELRVIKPGRARKIGNTKFRYYPLEWRFVFISSAPVDPYLELVSY